jgi:hypothetical protein
MLFWVNWIPLPQKDVTSPSATFQDIADTWQCLMGNVPHPGDESCGAGDGPAMKWYIVYLCFSLTFNICLLWLTKKMSAMWAQLATTLCLDLSNIFSQYKFIMGDSASWMSLSQWLATALASIALWTYNLEAEITPDVAQKTIARSVAGSKLSDDPFASVKNSANQKQVAAETAVAVAVLDP